MISRRSGSGVADSRDRGPRLSSIPGQGRFGRLPPWSGGNSRPADGRMRIGFGSRHSGPRDLIRGLGGPGTLISPGSGHRRFRGWVLWDIGLGGRGGLSFSSGGRGGSGLGGQHLAGLDGAVGREDGLHLSARRLWPSVTPNLPTKIIPAKVC